MEDGDINNFNFLKGLVVPAYKYGKEGLSRPVHDATCVISYFNSWMNQNQKSARYLFLRVRYARTSEYLVHDVVCQNVFFARTLK